MKLAPFAVSLACLVFALAMPLAFGGRLDQAKQDLTECESWMAKCQQELARLQKLEAETKAQGKDDEKIEASIKEQEALRQTLEMKIKDARAYYEKIEKVSKEDLDTIKGVSNICPVHHMKMTRERIPISYGMMAIFPGDPPGDVIQKEFPFYALKYWPGGCIVGDRQTAIIYVCPECAREEKAWVAAHKGKQLLPGLPKPSE